MTTYYEDATVQLHHGDCLDVLRGLPDASVDSVVTDPPYGLEFMGKAWDKFGTDTGNGYRETPRITDGKGVNSFQAGRPFQQWCELWAAECLRVLKPGGHLLAFGGTRTWHRLACAVEDAGFEVRDSIAWMYGSGFPKSLDVSKAIDRKRDDSRDVLAVTTALADLAEAAGITRADLDDAMGTSDMGGWWLSRLGHRCACPSVENWTRLRDIIPGAPELDAEVWRLNGRKGEPGEAWRNAEVIGIKEGAMSGWNMDGTTRFIDREEKAPATDAARTWQGWGTALKPAFEPVVVARKPLTGTVAANVLAWGTGALNIDGCRVEGEVPTTTRGANQFGSINDDGWRPSQTGDRITPHAAGRWPANVVLDSESAAELDQQSGMQRTGTTGPGAGGFRDEYVNGERKPGKSFPQPAFEAEGGASRFFYVAKADAGERVRVAGIAHPTVKPLALMRWLVRLVTPPGGTVLEPFAGSGTTVEACILEGFHCVAIEREADYLPLIVQRINRRRDPVAAVIAQGDDAGLFDLLDGEPA